MQNEVIVSTENTPIVKAKAASRQGAFSARNAKKVGPAILILCLALAIIAVLLIPVFVNGNAPVSRGAMRAVAVKHEIAEFDKVSDAAAQAGFSPNLPAALPDGTQLAAIRTLDGSIIEMEYRINGSTLVLRTAPGNGDLSGTIAEYPFITNEEAGGITRSYMGATAKQFSLAMWANSGYSYALVAPVGMDAELVRQVAESIQ